MKKVIQLARPLRRYSLISIDDLPLPTSLIR
jgi:hypothetical protein